MGYVLQRVNTENIININNIMQKSEVNLSEDAYDIAVQSFSNHAVVMNLGVLNLIRKISYYSHNTMQPFKNSY
jgi:hypothetical protein